MKRMLINATQREELRVAIVDGQSLFDLDIEIPAREQKKANIYKGRITRVEPSLEAAFIEYGGERHGFLPLKEIAPEYFADGADPGKVGIRELIREGQSVVVQVDKEERGNKGAALTTFISLAGRYLVLMPNNPKAGGVSRKIEGEERQNLRETLDQLDVPEDMGIIVRTAGLGLNVQELQWDLDYLVQVWKAIADAALSKPAPFLIYQESRLIIRALRDYLRADVSEVLIDQQELYDEAQEFMQQVMPQSLRKLKLYQDTVPLFSRYQIESQIENAHERTVRLPSGGSMVIDRGEALTAIDINSARATKGSDIEDTAFNTNREAAVEIARQLRIRDLGGLVVIDFIDMESSRHQREVEDTLKDALQADRARVQVGRISRFGLLEMSRQRLRPSLGESTHGICPRCEGHGHIRSIDSLSLSILRLMEEEAMKDNTGEVLVQAPPDVANYLLNEKRSAISEIELRHEAPVVVVADRNLETPHFEVTRLRTSEIPEHARRSYQRATEVQPVLAPVTQGTSAPGDEPAVSRIEPHGPAPQWTEPAAAESGTAAPAMAVVAPATTGFVAWLKRLFGIGVANSADTSQARPEPSDAGDARRGRGRSTSGRRDSQARDGRRSRGEGKRDRDRERGDAPGRGRVAREERSSSRSRPDRSAGRAENGKNETRDEPRTRRDSQRKTVASSDNAAGSPDALLDETTAVVTATQEKSGANAAGAAHSDETSATDSTTRTRRRGRRGGRRRRKTGEGEGAGADVAASDDQQPSSDAAQDNRPAPVRRTARPAADGDRQESDSNESAGTNGNAPSSSHASGDDDDKAPDAALKGRNESTPVSASLQSPAAPPPAVADGGAARMGTGTVSDAAESAREVAPARARPPASSDAAAAAPLPEVRSVAASAPPPQSSVAPLSAKPSSSVTAGAPAVAGNAPGSDSASPAAGGNVPREADRVAAPSASMSAPSATSAQRAPATPPASAGEVATRAPSAPSPTADSPARPAAPAPAIPPKAVTPASTQPAEVAAQRVSPSEHAPVRSPTPTQAPAGAAPASPPAPRPAATAPVSNLTSPTSPGAGSATPPTRAAAPAAASAAVTSASSPTQPPHQAQLLDPAPIRPPAPVPDPVPSLPFPVSAVSAAREAMRPRATAPPTDGGESASASTEPARNAASEIPRSAQDSEKVKPEETSKPA